MACSSGCLTKDHKTYGECMRSKTVKVTAYDVTAQKKADSTLDKYASLRKSGVQPKSTRSFDVEFADRISDKTGTAYQA